MVRERVRAGELDVAWSLIQKLPESSNVLREGIPIAVARADIPGALQWYERLIRREPSGDAALLKEIGLLRARELAKDSDPRVVVGSCRAQIEPRRRPSCVTEIRRIADDANVDMGTRLAAAGTLIDARMTGAEAMFNTLVGIATDRQPAVAAGALTSRAASSIHSLILLAGNSDHDAKYIATLALAQLRAKEALPVLRTIASDREAGAARLMAYVGLAASGDAGSLKVINETLPLMKGRDLLEAARALVALKDPRGVPILRSIAEGNDESLRIDAAEALYRADPTLASSVIRAGSESTNPWARARAFEAAAKLHMPMSVSLRRSLLDSNAWVAIRAVQAITAGEAASSNRAQPDPAPAR
jgi:HEAT repeat protein